MDIQHKPAASTSSHEKQSSLRLHGRWLLVARVVWGLLVGITLTIFFASLPLYIEILQTPCAGPTCEYQQLTPAQVMTLKGVGLSIGAYTTYIVTFTLLILGTSLAVSALIIWRRSHDLMALFV